MKIAPLVLAHDDETDCYSMKSLFGEEHDENCFPDNHPNQWPNQENCFLDNHPNQSPNQWLPRQPSEYGMFADNSRCSAMKPLKVKKLKRKPARPARF